MTDSQLTAEVLLNLGFVDVGKWQPKGDSIAYALDGADASASEVLLDAPNALYAFVRDDHVVYIGKTARSIRKRYVGYCRPGKTQAPNQRCHRNITAATAEGTEIRIFVFTPITHLRYSDFEINLAAGLEDSLIRGFDPPWNGKDRGTRSPKTPNARKRKNPSLGHRVPFGSRRSGGAAGIRPGYGNLLGRARPYIL
ncbi:GIY-YIG nuclease family protein [Sinorhizobium fredii]|uniref:GIY-YIG nuclease family protein n=1 Tax=Rhizobium fredii TaxID=380 RepID=UPI000688B36A|nr:GIY-YIG nuclease family protein [Sinorhizobium fredii]